MATFAIGDVHGCWETLEGLLIRLPLDPARDRLWLVGDLVNRGPRSLEVLRWARETAGEMGERFAVVLGNHDLRLLALAAGVTRAKRLDTLGPVLAAEDAGELVAWLGARPFVHRGRVGEGEWLMVHAGFLPEWTVEDAEAASRRVEAELAGPLRTSLLVRGSEVPEVDDPALQSLRRELATFTLLRTLDAEGRPCPHSGPLEETPEGCVPWFRVAGRRTAGERIVCGHWSALGFHREDGVLALDSGCVWGDRLTAVRLDDGEVFEQETVESADELPSDD
jgi:bis(5'-nucleosyl)-tetraphosphatase (symmetrical)